MSKKIRKSLMNSKSDRYTGILIWVLSSSLLIFLVRGKYGFGDDYVFLGWIKETSSGIIPTFHYQISPGYNAGRVLYAGIFSLVFPYIANIDALVIARIIGCGQR